MITLDPNGKFPGVPKEHMQEFAGLIPRIVADAVLAGACGAREVYDAMVLAYGYGDYSSINWGTISEDGTYVSSEEEDPDLDPVVMWELPCGTKVRLYNHAIVSVVDDEETIITRMD
jgi:hypothetical protein